MVLCAIFLAVVLIFVANLALAQKTGEPATPPPAPYECYFTEGAITIDGKPDEEAWKLAHAVNDFTIPWARDGKTKPPTATRAKLLWDREYLYFYAEMDDSDLFADVIQHDGQTWNNDVLELFFKPADEKPGYYEFQVSAANVTMDMFLPRRGAGGYDRFKSDGEFDFKTAVVIDGTLNKWTDTDKGWKVEGRFSGEISPAREADQIRARCGSSPFADTTTRSILRVPRYRQVPRSKPCRMPISTNTKTTHRSSLSAPMIHLVCQMQNLMASTRLRS